MKALSVIDTNALQSDMPIEEHYTVEEVAESLKFNPRTVMMWLKKGKLKGIKIGNDWRITESAVKDFIAENEVKKK